MKTITTMRRMHRQNGLMLGLLLMLPFSATARTYFVHPDHLGTPQVITDSNQAVVWQADYEPFGQATVTTGTITNNLRFPGQYFDQETNLHYNMFRYYSPDVGRYVTSDPIGLVGGLNTYSYALQNPTRFTDPKGLYAIPFPVIVKIAEAAFAGLAGTAIGIGITEFFDPGEEEGPSDDPFECIEGCKASGDAAKASCSALFKGGFITEEQLVDCFLEAQAIQDACIEACRNNCQ